MKARINKQPLQSHRRAIYLNAINNDRADKKNEEKENKKLKLVINNNTSE